jgi:hypothetical protein
VQVKIEHEAINILDLEEFSHLDPIVKDMYKKHIVKTLMPAIMSAVNNELVDNHIDSQIKAHDADISKFVYKLAMDIKRKGLQAIPETSKKLAVDSAGV